MYITLLSSENVLFAAGENANSPSTTHANFCECGFVSEKYHKVEIENVMIYFQNYQKCSCKAAGSVWSCHETTGSTQCPRLQLWTLLLKDMHLGIFFPPPILFS